WLVWLRLDPMIEPVRSDKRFKRLLRRIGLEGASKRQARKRASTKAITSLAILPLANDCDDPGMDYFSDGITESIINMLAGLPRIRVVARSSAFRYKGRQSDPQEAGRELGVQAVVTGRVRQTENRLIVSAELIDVATNSQLWGEQYNKELSDIFEVQEEIAREIAGKLRLRLSRKEKGRIGRRHTDNVEAYQAYLKGRYFWNRRTIESLKKGIEYFRQAIDTDPSYASAYAGLSDSYTLLVVREAIWPEEGFAKAKAAAEMALKIDEDFAEAHASLGHAMLHNWEWGDAEKELKRAIALNPGYPSAHHWYSEHLTAMGRCEEAITELKLAERLDPLSLIISADLARAFYYARDYDEVMKQEARTLEMDPDFWLSHINLGRSYTQRGMHAEAIDHLEKARAISAGNTEVLSFLAFAYAASGRRDEALRTLHELDELAKHSYVPSYHFAIAHAGLGQKDQALAWLDRAVEKHAVDLFTLKVEPMFDCLRSDPRFEDLLRRVGLAEMSPAAEAETGGRA
ncbi:MAG TPA: tetratricopeptide repeat protein, partial [Blastocatellia bacterium]|nr:tetratricopeptide repeat protein [Blastocatellia bacterium]